MQYLHVVAQYPPTTGGAERYCASVSEALAVLGYAVQVFTSRLQNRDTWQNELPRIDMINNVPIRRFSALHRGRITWRFFHWCKKRYAIRPRLSYELGLMLGEGPVCPALPTTFLGEASQFGVVHVFGLYSALAWQVVELSRLRNRPIVVTPFTHRETDNLQMIWKQRALHSAVHLIAMTHQEQVYLSKRFDIPEKRISVVSPAISVSNYKKLSSLECRNQLGIPDSAFVIMFLGRKEENKGIPTLIAAWQELIRRGNTFAYLLLVGPDSLYSQRLLFGCSQQEGFLNLGVVNEKTKLIALNACDCLVLASRSESFGIVLLEAWAVGKPVVAARSAAASELISPGQNGLLFEVGSVAQLADQLEALTLDPTYGSAMGQEGMSGVLADFTLQAMGAKIANIYEGLSRDY